MSCKIQTFFAVRNMKIMQDSLNKLGFNYTEKGDGTLAIKRRYKNIVISEDMISCDSANQHEVNKIKVEYGRNLGISIVEEMGALYKVEETKNEIVILA